MDKEDAARAVLVAALAHVPFEGWSMAALKRGAEDAEVDPASLIRLFPAGPEDALRLWISEADAQMEALYAASSPPPKIRDRIALIVRLRLEAYAAHRQALRRALAFYALPMHAHQGVAALARTADAMWRLAGDEATDFSWYTKRAILSAVYSSTLLYWLNDESPGHEATWKFLDRRIADAMKIGKLKQAFRAPFSFRAK